MSFPDGTLPRVLLVEDDAISRDFLQAALRALPADVDAAASCADAMASAHAYDLWLIDANLPDGSGIDLLRRLRERWPATRALAHTADPSTALGDALRAAGFSEVLVKPLTAATLHRCVRGSLGLRNASNAAAAATDHATIPAWDDDIALKALGGEHAHVLQLRQLFLAELPSVQQACLAAFDAGDAEGLRASLHRLRASCGFVGAARLGAIVAQWQDVPGSADAGDAFVAAIAELQRPR